MKLLKMKYFILLLFSVALFTSCGDDDETEISVFVGDYVINKATVTEAFTLATIPALPSGPIEVPVGQDITAVIQSALLSAVVCSSPTKSYIEMREDETLYLSCEEDNPLNAGTWEELNATSIKLNMNNAAIPASQSGFVLTVIEIAMTNTTLTGITTVPIPKDMHAAMVTSMSQGSLALDMDATPVALPVTFQLELLIK